MNTTGNKKVKAYIGDMELEFETPLKVGGKEISKITLREPTVEDLEAVEHMESKLQQTYTIIANIGGFTIDEVRKFPSQVFMRLQEKVSPFLF